MSLQDDGIGGAELSKGSGLIGLKDRVETLGGTLDWIVRAEVGHPYMSRSPSSFKPAAIADPLRGGIPGVDRQRWCQM